MSTPSCYNSNFYLERTLSNTTYLRRLHIKFQDAQRLFFGSAISPSLFQNETGAMRYLPDKTILRTEVLLLDARGKIWMMQYECVLRHGQRHSRIKGGWNRMCQCNNLTVGDKIRFQRLVPCEGPVAVLVHKVLSNPKI